MPKFSKKCQNPFQDELSDDSELCKSRIINLRVYGLDKFAQVFSRFLLDEKNVTSKNIRRICRNCLQRCPKKRNVTRHLPQELSTNETETKVSYYLVETSIVVVCLKMLYCANSNITRISHLPLTVKTIHYGNITVLNFPEGNFE